MLEDTCSGELEPEVGSIGEILPWFDIAKPLVWEPWYPTETTSGLDVIASARSMGLHWNIWKYKNSVTISWENIWKMEIKYYSHIQMNE